MSAQQPQPHAAPLAQDEAIPTRPFGEGALSLEPGMGDAAYLERLRDHLPPLLEQVDPDVVFYDAGVDPHAEDSLGRLSLSDAGLLARDRWVLETLMAWEVPTACVIGGGYDRDHARLARRHATLHRAASDVATGLA